MTLTKSDLAKIKKIIKNELKGELKDYPTKKDLDRQLRIYATKFDLQELKDEINEKLANLPNKQEFFKRMDKLSGELKKMRETYKLASPKISDHENRITDLEDLHPQGKHDFA